MRIVINTATPTWIYNVNDLADQDKKSIFVSSETVNMVAFYLCSILRRAEMGP